MKGQPNRDSNPTLVHVKLYLKLNKDMSSKTTCATSALHLIGSHVGSHVNKACACAKETLKSHIHQSVSKSFLIT